MVYKCSCTQSLTPTYQKRKFKRTDEWIKQLSMQCHVRTVCSRLVLIGIECSRVFYGCLVIRQRNRDRLWTRVGGCSQQQWQQCELWHQCSKMSVFQAILFTQQDFVWKYVTQMSTVQWFLSQKAFSCVVCVLDFDSEQSHRYICPPDQCITYLQTAVWKLHKPLSKYQKLSIIVISCQMDPQHYFPKLKWLLF